MSQSELPVIDNTICIACGACIDICPDRVLQTGEKGDVIIVGERCMLCGHCHALCPVEAISIPALKYDLGLVNIGEKSFTSQTEPVAPAALLQLMRARRSCRVFKSDPVELSLLTDLVRIGTTAPSGTNSQGWQFIVLPERSDVEQLGEVTSEFYRNLNRKAANPFYRFLARLFAGDALGRYYRRYYTTIEQSLAQWREKRIDRLFHGAPAAIIVAADKSSSCPVEDALLATQNILLAAQSMELGTCLIGFVVEAARRDKRIGSLLRLGVNERIHSVIACGYPEITFLRATGRKSVEPRIVRLFQEKQNAK